MNFVIDSSSLLSLVRYYLPFDGDNKLYNFIESKVSSKEIIILDKVAEECKYITKGIVYKSLSFIRDKKNHYDTSLILPNKKFYNQLENNFINKNQRRFLNEPEFESRKSSFLESADAKLLLFCIQKNDSFTNYAIVSEETTSSNDNKAFKKLPVLCNLLDLEIYTLPDVLQKYNDIKLQYI